MINLVQVNTDEVHYSSIFDLNIDVPNRDTVEMNYKDIYLSLAKTLEAFEKHLLCTTLKKHQHCIKRFVGMYKRRDEKFPPICPYAYAYVFWKESVYHINPFINEGKRYTHKNIKPFDLPFHFFEEGFKELLMVFNRSDYRMMKWILNHLLWEVASKHFNKMANNR